MSFSWLKEKMYYHIMMFKIFLTITGLRLLLLNGNLVLREHVWSWQCFSSLCDAHYTTLYLYMLLSKYAHTVSSFCPVFSSSTAGRIS